MKKSVVNHVSPQILHRPNETDTARLARLYEDLKELRIAQKERALSGAERIFLAELRNLTEYVLYRYGVTLMNAAAMTQAELDYAENRATRSRKDPNRPENFYRKKPFTV